MRECSTPHKTHPPKHHSRMPAQYQPVIHTTARRELDQLTPSQQDRLTSTIQDIARHEQPTTHPATRSLEGQHDLFRVRVGDLRAVLRLEKPQLKVLKVGERASVYDNIDSLAAERDAVSSS